MTHHILAPTKRITLLAFALIASFNMLHAQTMPDPVPYVEPNSPEVIDITPWTQLPEGILSGWSRGDLHYERHHIPNDIVGKDTTLYVWKGERIGLKAAIYSREATSELQVRLSASTSKALKKVAEAKVVRYLLTDGFQACGQHPTDLPAYLVDDIIDNTNSFQLGSCETRPIWINLEIPRNIKAGHYTLGLDIISKQENKVIDQLTLNVNVLNRALPAPTDYKMHVNFWMQPFASARYYKLTPFSEAHLEVLRPYMQMLARAGQKVALAILFYEPWGDQSYDKFQPMVDTRLNSRGEWQFDFTLFDQWISFLETCGIKEQINCFSMVPWDMNFRYYDEASASYKNLHTTTETEEYRTLWTTFLQAFASHLKQKGWYDKTVIAMDERGLQDMQNAYEVAQAAVPGIKIALAGNYHTELADKVFDYCVAYGQHFTQEELAMRKAKGFVTTTYNCCSEAAPNILANSEPQEATYVPLYCAANNFDGYLRWAWQNWHDTPLTDSRWRLFSPGDTYSIYPGPRSSVRFEGFIHGVEAYEKVQILREEYKKKGLQADLQELENELQSFQSSSIEQAENAGHLYRSIQKILNKPTR